MHNFAAIRFNCDTEDNSCREVMFILPVPTLANLLLHYSAHPWTALMAIPKVPKWPIICCKQTIASEIDHSPVYVCV